MTAREAIIEYLRETMRADGHGRLYSAEEMAEGVGRHGVSIAAADVPALVREKGGITIRYCGGNSGRRITFDHPNRSATLQRIDAATFSFDTELAVQNGLRRWFISHGYIARQEVRDCDAGAILERRTIENLPEHSEYRGTACRDLMAHHPSEPVRTFHILEVKGLTQWEADFYMTFGQVFPIDDSAITKGWTDKKVPKHGLCLKYARRFAEAWRESSPLITLVVVVPDFPPLHLDQVGFYDRLTRYYPKQAEMYRSFLRDGDIDGDHAFARLLRHLRDRYGLLKMVSATEGVAFRFWGYQGLNWVRDFATGCAVELQAGAEA